MAEIITAAVTGCVTLIGVLLSNRAAQAVTDEEVREHNEFARRMPVVEERLRGMEHRVEKLERGCGPERRPLS